MKHQKQGMRVGLFVLITASIVLGGWLTSQSVALADEDENGRSHRVQVLGERIAAAKLTLGGAIEAAEKATGGVAVEAEYELEDDGLEIEVIVLVDQKFKEVEFDAMTGKMEVDDDDEHEDDDEDDD